MGKDYSIKNTTKVQREKIANEALGISTLDAVEPSAEAKALVNEYVDGKIEIEDALKKIIDKHSMAV